MSENEWYTSRCPVCDSILDLDRDRGYSCRHCGWNESVELEEDDVWIIPGDRGDRDISD
jgi:hypothetical protein